MSSGANANSGSRWLTWTPAARISADSPTVEPAKPSEPVAASADVPLDVILPGRAIEFMSETNGRLLLVSNEDEARRAIAKFRARRGQVYTLAEFRALRRFTPAEVAEIHIWKRQSDGILRLNGKATV